MRGLEDRTSFWPKSKKQNEQKQKHLLCFKSFGEVTTAWTECYTQQKRLLADAMVCERAARPFLSSETEPMGASREDAIDALLVSAIRLCASVKSFFVAFVAPTASSADSFSAACSIVEKGAARHKHRTLLAALLVIIGAVESRLKDISDNGTKRVLFGSLSIAGEGSHVFVEALDVLESGYGTPSQWQLAGPEEQLALLPKTFDSAGAGLVASARALAKVLSEVQVSAEVAEAWTSPLANLNTCIKLFEE
jgi:hypothetical protein